MHVGINAHLLSGEKGYRTAGIHGYIFNILARLEEAAPEDWQFSVMVGRGNPHHFNGLTMRQALFDTRLPLKRILWEQVFQPAALAAFDLYHAMAFVSPMLLNRPSVVTVYDLSFIHHPQILTPARRLYLRMFTTLSCARASRIIAISHSTAHDIATSLNISSEKIDVAACGYNTERYRPLPPGEVEAFRQREGLPARFWLFLGTLEPRKNLTTLLDAYAALPKSERLPLILAGGKGWLYDEIFERVQRHGLGDGVYFPGFIPAEVLPLWYNSAEVLMMPSVFEGFGLPVLEAMACGTPVIVADASSLPEVVGDAGIKVPPHNVSAWCDALQCAFKDRTWREEAILQGRIEARRYSWQKTAAQTINTYRRVMGLSI